MNIIKKYLVNLLPEITSILSWPRFIIESSLYLKQGWPNTPHAYVKRAMLVAEAKLIKADVFIETAHI